jgi:hypothetical protein
MKKILIEKFSSLVSSLGDGKLVSLEENVHSLLSKGKQNVDGNLSASPSFQVLSNIMPNELKITKHYLFPLK